MASPPPTVGGCDRSADLLSAVPFRTSADGPDRLLLVMQGQNEPTGGGLTGRPVLILKLISAALKRWAHVGPSELLRKFGLFETSWGPHLRSGVLLLIAGGACGGQMPAPAGTGGFIGRLDHRSSHPSTVLATVAVFNESRTACLSSAPCCFCTPASRTIPETHAAALRRAARQAGPAKRSARTKLLLFVSFVFSIQERDGMFAVKLPFLMLCLTSPIWRL